MLTDRSLFQKIFLSHIIVVIITIASLGLLLTHLISEYLIDARKNQLIHDGSAVIRLLEDKHSANETAEYLANTSSVMGVKMWIVRQDRSIIGETPRPWQQRHNGGGHMMRQNNNHNRSHNGRHRQDAVISEETATTDAMTSAPPAPPPAAQLQRSAMEEQVFKGEISSWVRKSPRDDDPSIIVALPYNNNTEALFLYTPILGITKTAASLQQLLLYSSFAAILAAALIAFFIARNLATPISRIAGAAGEFARGSYAARAPESGSAEIAALGRAFNNMAASIEQTELNRREFFANVTHELKTPIASIQLLSEALLDDMVGSAADKQRYLESIVAETGRMNHLISDLLDLERLESGSFKFSFTNIDINELHNQLSTKLQPLLSRRSLTLTATFNGTLQPVHTDGFRLEQIITNLLTNAIRHSPEQGSIEAVYTFAEQLTIEIIDHGEGISAENLPHIWERFYRIDKARSRADGGTGLGLSITRKLTEELGGSITAASSVGEKTVFTLHLPLTPKPV